jgi:hypothetical protein
MACLKDKNDLACYFYLLKDYSFDFASGPSQFQFFHHNRVFCYMLVKSKTTAVLLH